MTQNETDTSKLWSEEYKKQGIPSSFRTEPSSTVAWFYDFLKKRDPAKAKSGHVLEVGCGKGRNSFYFAEKGFQTDGIELVPELVEEVNKRAAAENLPMKAHCQSIADPLPFSDKTFDIVLDIFVYKHLTSKEKQAAFRKELKRVLKDEGYYVLSLAADDDGFYGPLLKNSPDLKNKMIIDPYTNISSYLYSNEDIEKEFAPDFKIMGFLHKKSTSPMHGKNYERSVLNFIMKKTSNP